MISSPAIGEEALVPAGREIYSHHRQYILKGVETDIDVRPAGLFGLRMPTVPAGSKLVPVKSSAALKACVPLAGTFVADGPCFLDDDGDGLFDRSALDNIKMALKLKSPVPYSASDLEIVGRDSFRSTIIYQGSGSDSLKFSYREFSDNLARPAFTEDLLVPREAVPSLVMVKNLKLEVISVSGLGLKYRIVDVLP